jgi:hypothetical protein
VAEEVLIMTSTRKHNAFNLPESEFIPHRYPTDENGRPLYRGRDIQTENLLYYRKIRKEQERKRQALVTRRKEDRAWNKLHKTRRSK